MKILSLFLSIIIILTSCNKEQSNILNINVNPIPFKVENNYTLWNYPYIRPNYEEISEKIKSFLNLIIISENDFEALSNVLKIFEEIDNAENLKNISIARFAVKNNTLENKADILYHLKSTDFIDNIKYNLYLSVYSSPHKDYILQHLTPIQKSDIYNFRKLIPLNRDDNINFRNCKIELLNFAFVKDEIFTSAYENFLKNQKVTPKTSEKAFDIFSKINSYKIKKYAKSNFENLNEFNFQNCNYSISEIKMLIKYIKDFILPVYKLYNSEYENLPNLKFSQNDIINNSASISNLSEFMLNKCIEKETLYLNDSDFLLPFPIYIKNLTVPFICFKPQSTIQNSILNRIIGKGLYISCNNGIVNSTINEISALSYDILSKQNIIADKNIYYFLKETLFFSFLTELQIKLNDKNEFSTEEFKKIFSTLISEYFPGNENKDSILFLSSLILSLKDNVSDFLIAYSVASQLEVIKSFNPNFAKEVFSSLLVSGEIKDLKTFLRNIGLESPFNANSVKNSAKFYEDILTPIASEKSN